MKLGVLWFLLMSSAVLSVVAAILFLVHPMEGDGVIQIVKWGYDFDGVGVTPGTASGLFVLSCSDRHRLPQLPSKPWSRSGYYSLQHSRPVRP